MQYIHKQNEVEAIQLTPDTFDQCIELIGAENTNDGTSKDECYIGFSTEADVRSATKGDYIIKGVLGKVYPCSPEVFEESYEIKE